MEATSNLGSSTSRLSLSKAGCCAVAITDSPVRIRSFSRQPFHRVCIYTKKFSVSIAYLYLLKFIILLITPLIPYVEKIWPTVSKLGANVIKKKLVFHEICQSLGIVLSEDDFVVTYLQSLSIFLLDVEHQWAELFQLEDVRTAFQAGYMANDMAAVRQLLEHHLHVTIKFGTLKELNAVPDGLLEAFVTIYTRQVNENLGPSAMENVRAANHISDKIDQKHNQLIGVLEMFRSQQTVSLDNYMHRGDVEQIIDNEHQAQLDEIKKAFDEHKIKTAQKNLLEFKERIWAKTTDNIRFKVLTNIGYTFMMLKNFDAAIPYYQEAAVFKADHAGNLSTLASLYLVKRRYDEAKPIARKLAGSHPAIQMSLDLYQVPENELPKDPGTLVPQEMLDQPELLLALINISHKQRQAAALKYARRLYELNKESDNFIDIYCNIVCVTVVGEHIDFQTTELLGEEDRTHLWLAQELLSKQWEKFKHADARELQAALLEKLNMVLTVLGEQQEALKVADRLLEVSPGNYFGLKQAGINLMFLHRFAEAAARFAQIGVDHPQLNEFHTSWLLALGKTGQMDKVTRIAYIQLDKDISAEDRQRILHTLAFLYAENEQYEEALHYIDRVMLFSPTSLGVLADKAKTLRLMKKDREAQKVESQMLQMIDDHLAEQTLRDRYFAATYFMQFGKAREAAALLETVVEPRRNHFLTYQLIEAWIQSGQKARALPVCANLRERFGPHPEYTVKEVEIYYHYHDYLQAEKILTEFVRHFPDDLSAQLNLAGLYHRNRNYKALGEFCNADMSRFKFRADQLWRYIQLLRGGGYHRRCLELLYEHRRDNPSFESNQLFINFCLADPEERKHTIIPEKAGKNTAVTLVSASITFCYVILDKPSDQLKRKDGEINLQDPIYRVLKGKKKGQRIALHENQEENWEITKILPLYTHVFQDAIHQNSTIYASQSGIISGEFKEPADLDKFIGKHLLQRERFAAMMAEQEKNYRGYLLPLSAYAIFNKSSPINIYEYFSGKCGIRATTGDVEMYNQAVQAATAQTQFVPDITALLTLYKIGFKRPKGISKFIIPHTTADMIYNHVEKKSLEAHTDHMSIGLQNGETIGYVVTAERTQNELARLKEFQSWVESNCDVRPCKTLLDYDSSKWQRFKKTIGIDVFETALLSLDVGGLFLCDDHATRALLDEELQIKGVWTQASIRSLVVRNLISADQGYDYYIGLLKLGHRHTTIDKDAVLYALAKSNYTMDADVEAIIDVLSGYHSDENSVQIVFAVIAELSSLLLPPKQFEGLTYYLLMRFLSGRAIFPLYKRFYRMSEYFVKDVNLSLVVKHAIWQLITDHRFPSLE